MCVCIYLEGEVLFLLYLFDESRAVLAHVDVLWEGKLLPDASDRERGGGVCVGRVFFNHGCFLVCVCVCVWIVRGVWQMEERFTIITM